MSEAVDRHLCSGALRIDPHVIARLSDLDARQSPEERDPPPRLGARPGEDFKHWGKLQPRPSIRDPRNYRAPDLFFSSLNAGASTCCQFSP
jgi:hypothetical protein